MVSAADKKLSKTFEKDVQLILEGLRARYPITYVRLYDTHSARGKFLPEQPGDWIVASPTGGHLLEAKTSTEHGSLQSCLSSHVKEHQAASHRLWARAGQPCWFLFYSEPLFLLEMWPGKLVGECRASGKKLPKRGESRWPLSVSRDSLEDLLYNHFMPINR